MKKNQNKKINFLIRQRLITIILGLLFTVSSTQLIYAEKAITPLLHKEATILFDRDRKSTRLNSSH